MTDIPIYGYRQQQTRRPCPKCGRQILVTPITGVFRGHDRTPGIHCDGSGQPAWTNLETL